MRLHVVPGWQEHELTPACWCGPFLSERDVLDATGGVFVHRLANDGPQRINPEADPGPRLGGWVVVEEAVSA